MAKNPKKPGGSKGKREAHLTIKVPIDRPKRKNRKATAGSFKPGHPYRYQPGHAPVPGAGRKLGGKNRMTKLSESYKLALEDEAPEDLKKWFGVTGKCTMAEIIALGMTRRAAIEDTTAAKELREVTEGKLPDTLNLEGNINYNAGKSAKDILTAKLDGPLPAPPIEGSATQPEVLPEVPKGESPK